MSRRIHRTFWRGSRAAERSIVFHVRDAFLAASVLPLLIRRFGVTDKAARIPHRRPLDFALWRIVNIGIWVRRQPVT
jgi:hypothetical protein